MNSPRPQRIAIVGSGISGLSAAWLLSQQHDVTVYEAAPRIGGHANTVQVGAEGGSIPVDTGFIVYNAPTYPNFVAMLDHLGVGAKHTDMSFAVSMDDGALEYSGSGLSGLFAQRRNVLSPRFLSMVRDLVRFYRTAAVSPITPDMSLDDFLDAGRYGRAFREDHLYPMAAAIWSTPAGRIGEYPASAFISFCENHRLLALGARPIWRTVEGGSRTYVAALAQKIGPRFRLATAVESVRRLPVGVEIRDGAGGVDTFDQVVLASHADQTLRMLADANDEERRILGAFRYTRNHAILHSDTALMPRRRAVWSSWNYIASRRGGGEQPPAVSYWMNQLQSLPTQTPYFVTLNATHAPRDELVHREETYEHPLFDAAAAAAQPEVWSLQGVRRTWFCGAWMGAGFHEDGLQAGLAVAEALGGVRRPWTVPNESGRIHIGASPAPAASSAEIAA